MPLYEYECKQCHQRLEKIQSFNSPPETKCPNCGGELERLISAPAIQFKGAGWYVNDYAKGGSKPAKSESIGKADISAAASDSKSDSGSSKPAAPSSEATSTSSAPSTSSDSAAGKSGAGSSSTSKPS